MPAISAAVDYDIVYDLTRMVTLLTKNGANETMVDGWTNADHPTEFTPGNPSGLPSGVDINATDLDYTGMIMPPPNPGFRFREAIMSGG